MPIIASLPYTLTNGQVADATQVMADFNAIVNNVNSNAVPLTSAIGDALNYAADTGSVNAIIIAPANAPSSYSDGLRMRTKAANTNTSSTVTVKFGSLGTKSVVIDAAGTLPPIGSIISGMHYAFEYDSTQNKCILINPSRANGSFTINLTGMTSTTTGTVSYVINPDGKSAFIWVSLPITGTSNSSSMTGTNIPSALTTATSKRYPFSLEDNGGLANPSVLVTGTSTTWTFGMNISNTGFTNSGTKGMIAAGLSINLD